MKWKRLVVTKGVEIKLSRLFDDAEPLIQGGIMKEKKGVMSLFSLIVSVLLTLSIMPLGAASAGFRRTAMYMAEALGPRNAEAYISHIWISL